MARFTDLPFELQTDIWTLVLPYRGGVHWLEFEGLPHDPEVVKQSLVKFRDVFGGREPTMDEVLGIPHRDMIEDVPVRDTDHGSAFFQNLYPIVPSLWGRSGGPALGAEEVLSQEQQDEITKTRLCRQLSTYTQITTLLSTCRISRLTALAHVERMDSNGYRWEFYRGVGPLCRPRPYSVWDQQYRNIEAAPDGLDKETALVPSISASLDLVVLRLHTASGYPTPILNHSFYQLTPRWALDIRSKVIPDFRRIGIEWHPLWATLEGRKEFCDEAVNNLLRLTGSRNQVEGKIYWLVDGVPRPQWDQYPPAIPAAFNEVMERQKPYMLRGWSMEPALKSRLMEHHDLYQEYEANGRRYYVVLVIANWNHEYYRTLFDEDETVEELYPVWGEPWPEALCNPGFKWDPDGPFPGGEDLWPEALRDPARLAYELRRGLLTGHSASFVLSWEPI